MINGSTVDAQDAALTGNNTNGDMNFEVKGGTLIAKQGAAIYMPGQINLQIIGGTFSSSPVKYVADGKSAIKFTSGQNENYYVGTEKELYILGSTGAVASSFEKGLKGMDVKRRGGASRYDTNIEILYKGL